jgi:hypothetical protein
MVKDPKDIEICTVFSGGNADTISILFHLIIKGETMNVAMFSDN